MHTFPGQHSMDAHLKFANQGVWRSREKSKLQKLLPSTFGIGNVEHEK